MTRRQFLFIYTAILGGCHRAPPSPAGPAGPTVFSAHGVLQRVDPARGTAVVAHKAIPGYMEAMTMEFKARDPRELSGLAPGDVISFCLSVTDDRSWIDRISKTGVAPFSPSPSAEEDHSLHAGDLAPDCVLSDSEGRLFRVSDYRGQIVVMSFIFTRCPLPDYCPLIGAQLAETQRQLLAEPPSAPWHLLSISFDPDYDTPERLAAYAVRLHAVPASWTVATGASAEVLRFGSAFDLAVSREGGQLTHNLRTVVLDASGRIRKIYRGNTWRARELVDEVRQASADH